MISFLVSIAARFQRWAAVVAAVVVALATAYAVGRSKGGQVAKDAAAADKARSDLKAVEHTLEAVKERHHVEDEIARQPPGTAAGRLHDDWSRD